MVEDNSSSEPRGKSGGSCLLLVLPLLGIAAWTATEAVSFVIAVL